MLAVDAAATRVMGFDPQKVPMYKYLSGIRPIPDQVVLHDWSWSMRKKFIPHPGWVGHIEEEV